MFEQQLIELFVKYGPNSDGALEKASLAELNASLAKWYCRTEALHAKAPPPEPLPTDALRFPDFRQAMCRVLTSLNLSPEDKEEFLVKLLSQPREPAEEVAEDPRIRVGDRPTESRHTPLIEDAMPGVPQCWAPTASAAGDLATQLGASTAASASELADHLSAWVKDASGRDVNEVREKLLVAAKSYSSTAMAAAKDVIQTANEHGVMAAAKDVLHSANEYGASALEASKVYGEKAMEYGEKVLSSRKPAGANVASQMPQQTCSKLPAFAPIPSYESEECIGDSLLGTRGLPTLLASQEPMRGSSPPYQPSCYEASSKPREAPPVPPHLASIDVEWAKAKAKAATRTTWCYDAGDGLHVDIRATPDLDSERTGKWVNPGETFEVSRELRDGDGVTFLQLADGRGWLFDRKPGVGVMCRRQTA